MKKISKLLLAILSIFVATALVGCLEGTVEKNFFTVSVVEGTGGGVFEEGTEVTVKANQKGFGYDFDGWFEGTEKVAATESYTFVVDKDVTLKAQFTYDPYKGLSNNEKDDLTNDINRKFVDRYDEQAGNKYDGWPTTITDSTDVKSPLDSDSSALITIEPIKDAEGQFIDASLESVGAVWSTVDFGVMQASIDVTGFAYLEFDVKFDNAQPWVSYRFEDADGNITAEKGLDIPCTESKIISVDGWYHVVINLDDAYNVAYLVDESNELNADELNTLAILKNTVAIRFAFSDSKADQTKETKAYLDNVHLTDEPFDATQLETAIKAELAEIDKESVDFLSANVVENKAGLSFAADKNSKNGEDSVWGYKLVAGAELTGWPSVLVQLKESLDFTASAYSMDIKVASGCKWVAYKLYDSDWEQVGDQVDINVADNDFHTYNLVSEGDDIKFIRLYVDCEDSTEAVEVIFDNLVEADNGRIDRSKAVAVTAGKDTTIDFTTKYDGATIETISFDVFVADQGAESKMAIMVGNWDTYIGYLNVYYDKCEATGVTYEVLEDGYLRVTINVALVTKISGATAAKPGYADEVKLLYVRGGWTSAGGFVDNIVVNTLPARNNAIATTAGTDKTIDLSKKYPAGTIDSLSFDVKVAEGSGHIAVMTGNWDSYVGYINIYATGMDGSKAGVTCYKLNDGWYRVIVDFQAAGFNDRVEFIYVRGGWSDADAQIDHIVEVPHVEIVEPIDRSSASSFNAGQDCTIDFAKDDIVAAGKYAIVTFDYKLEDESGKIAVMVGNWNNHMGYFDLTAAGGTYAGITCKVLADGWVRVTLDSSFVTKLSGGTAPFAEEVKLLYVRGGWSNTAGQIFIVSVESQDYPTVDRSAAKAVKAGSDTTINFATEDKVAAGDTATIVFDYKITSADTTKFSIAIGNWDNYIGYFDANAAGVSYTGFSFETLSDGWIRVTVDTSAVTRINTGYAATPGFTDAINFIYVRGNWTTADGEIQLISVTPNTK